MRTVEVKLYSVDELPEDVRKKVVDKHRYINVHHDWWDFILEDFEEELSRYGLSAEDFAFDLHRKEFEMKKLCVEDTLKLLNNLAKEGCEEATRVLAMRLNGGWVEFDGLNAWIPGDDGTGEVEDVDLTNELEWLIGKLEKKFLETLSDEYMYQLSDEAVLETLRANGYEFTRDGRLF